MTLDELAEALDGLYAYDVGATDSGVKDEALRARCIEALEALPRGEHALYPPDLARLVRSSCLSEEALAAGYGLEDALEFVAWLVDRMGVPEPTSRVS